MYHRRVDYPSDHFRQFPQDPLAGQSQDDDGVEQGGVPELVAVLQGPGHFADGYSVVDLGDVRNLEDPAAGESGEVCQERAVERGLVNLAAGGFDPEGRDRRLDARAGLGASPARCAGRVARRGARPGPSVGSRSSRFEGLEGLGSTKSITAEAIILQTIFDNFLKTHSPVRPRTMMA